MTGYAVLFVVTAFVLLVAVPVCSWLEGRADERDRDRYARMFGGQR